MSVHFAGQPPGTPPRPVPVRASPAPPPSGSRSSPRSSSAPAAPAPTSPSTDGNGNTTPGGHPECVECPEPAPGELDDTSTTADDVDESGDRTWRVTGRLIVRDPTLDGVEDRDPIAGVKVKVSGASVGKIYNSWGTDATNANGEFSVSETAGAKHDVKVEVKFKSDDGDLRVKGPDSPTWYEIYETVDKIEPSDLELNGEPFGSGYGSGDAATTQARIDAQTWIAYRKALDYLDDIGRSALDDTVVNNPASLAAGDSWADPILHEIHIVPRRHVQPRHDAPRAGPHLGVPARAGRGLPHRGPARHARAVREPVRRVQRGLRGVLLGQARARAQRGERPLVVRVVPARRAVEARGADLLLHVRQRGAARADRRASAASSRASTAGSRSSAC